MSSKKLFSEWYGYDKVVKEPEGRYTDTQLGYRQASHYANFPKSLTPEGAALIRSLSLQERELMVKLYFPECDGLTVEDFATWIRTGKRTSDKYGRYYNWRIQKALETNPGFQNDYHFTSLITDFFKYKTRSDRLFRIIEINEFVNTASADQTFENFLETDTNYQEKCKNLEVTPYTKDLNKLFDWNTPKFLQFGNNFSLKARQPLLKLKPSEMAKVIKWDQNQYLEDSKADTSVSFVELFIGAALGKFEKVAVRELTPKEAQNAAMTAFLTGSPEFWNSLGAKKDIASTVDFVLNEMRQVSFQGHEFTRNFAYLLQTGVVSKLSPLEVMALIYGYHKSARWAEPNKGETTLEVATKMMTEGKLDPEFFAKLVAYIVINNLDLIVVNDDLVENSFEDMPISWAYPVITKSNRKRSLVHPKAVTALM